ncbi:MAG TPA: hypothetical protein VNK04_20720 [Gemmataceae bacterium]|jgi:hypothetical protein|nr:hypothetical protein [Gemmataceae bacterium]
MRRLIMLALLAALFLISTASCGSSSNDPSGPNPTGHKRSLKKPG